MREAPVSGTDWSPPSVKARGSKFSLDYKFGPGNLGGGFLITSVTGKDDSAETGDSWMIKFIALPPDLESLATAVPFAAVERAESWAALRAAPARFEAIHAFTVSRACS